MSNLLLIPILIIGSLVYLFLYWRSLKEDVPISDVFTSGLLILASGYVGFALAHLLQGSLFSSAYFDPGEIWFWFSSAFIVMVTFLMSRNQKLSVYEIFESVGVATLPLYSFIVVYFGLSNRSIETIVFGFFILTFLALYYYFQVTYKNFGWYKSGRVGFSGLTSLALLFMARALIAGWYPSMVSFTGRIEIVLSGIVSFLLIFMVYNLSEY